MSKGPTRCRELKYREKCRSMSPCANCAIVQFVYMMILICYMHYNYYYYYKLESIRTECSVVWLFNGFNYPVCLSSAKMMDFQLIGD